MIISLCGLLLGPTTVGIISDAFGDPTMLRYAVEIVPAVFGTIGFIYLPIINRIYLEQIKKDITL